MMHTDNSQLEIINKYINLFVIRYKLIIISALLTVSIGYAVYLRMPKIYESTASIMYQEQNINPTRLSPDQELRITEMVNTVTQQVLSRANLIQLVNDFNLYADSLKRLPIDDIIVRLREKDIHVNLDRQRGNVFSVSYRGSDPQTVMAVTNALSMKFIEENMRFREERARETSNYIQDELRMSKEKLQEKESQMRDYKLKYYNEMPEERANNMSRLNALQQQFQAIQANIPDREQTRLLITEQIEIRKNIQNAATATESGSGGAMDELINARNTLKELQSRYTHEHPRVQRLEKRIKQLESDLKASGVDSDNLLSGGFEGDARMQELVIQLKQVDLDLMTLRKESDGILTQIQTYQKWIDAAPIREAEWAALSRDYDELKRYHDTLVAQSLAAEAAETLEARQKGSQFKIVDPAYFPKTPVKGSFLKFFLASIAIGFAAGVGLILGLDFMDTSFKSRGEIENYLKIPVVCSIPLILTETEIKKNKIKDFMWHFFFVVWTLCLISAITFSIHKGFIIL
jgi:polysaccharide chain length determinant protein (PEP-CTERM system associated)